MKKNIVIVIMSAALLVLSMSIIAIAQKQAASPPAGAVKRDLQPLSPDYRLPGRFKGKTMLITGAARGMGRAAAVRAAREGASVIVADILVKEGNETLAMIRKEGGKALFVEADICSTSGCDRTVSEAVKAFGPLDYAINNAGVMDGVNPGAPFDFRQQQKLFPAPIHEATDEYWDKVIAVNATGTFKSLRAELRQMVAQGKGGSIVNVGSIAGLTGLPGNPAYVASKHSVTGLTRNAALDYARYGIRVNSVNMAATDTPMMTRAFEFVKAKRGAGEEGGMAGLKTQSILSASDSNHRPATVWEQAAVMLFLLSDEASNITGAAWPTDGGWTAY